MAAIRMNNSMRNLFQQLTRSEIDIRRDKTHAHVWKNIQNDICSKKNTHKREMQR